MIKRIEGKKFRVPRKLKKRLKKSILGNLILKPKIASSAINWAFGIEKTPIGNFWIRKEDYEKMVSFYKKLEDRVLRTSLYDINETIEKRESRRKRNEDNRKLACIKIANTSKIAWVDTKTMKAYKSAEYYTKTWIEIKDFEFIRWCRSFDI